ncbi:FMN-binding protein [Aurantivibrio infirmus]
MSSMVSILELAGPSKTIMNSDKLKRRSSFIAIAVFIAFAPHIYAEKGVFMTAQHFISQSFEIKDEQLNDGAHTLVQQKKLWLNEERKQKVEEILHHKYSSLRVRYWTNGKRTAWVLDEIGKEHPITFGVSVENGQILDVVVLEFRESRGGEIRYPFFTKQFTNASLDQSKSKASLTNSIDGITGATLSVRAAKKIATLALYFHEQIEFDGRLNEQLSTASE